MKNYKKILKENIAEIVFHRKQYIQKPDKDFCRDRKLPFETMLYSILSLGSKDLKCEIMDQFGIQADIPSVSAFVQQRSKISSFAFETLFRNFVRSAYKPDLYKGYRLLAVDGSDLHVPTNPQEKRSYYPGANGQRPYNLLHLNAMYDLTNRIYTDALVQYSRDANEHKAFTAMVDRDDCELPTVYIADRGYESYNNLAHIQEKGQCFLIRIKDVASRGGIAQGLSLPASEEFDIPFSVNLTRKQTNTAKADPNLKYLTHRVVFDYLPTKCKKSIPVIPYTIAFRIVRIQISENIFETLITNLPASVFSSSDLKQLYAMRWGIETSFRALKYTLGLIYFHSKKTEFILQEIFAKLTIYNFTELITSHVIIKQKKRKHPVQVNFSASVHICSKFLLNHIPPPKIEALISRFLIPIRHTVSSERKKSAKCAVSFLYRIA